MVCFSSLLLIFSVYSSSELNAVDSSSLSWRKCNKESSSKKGGDSKRSLVHDVLKRTGRRNGKNCSSKSKSRFTCPCQKLKDSMDFGISW